MLEHINRYCHGYVAVPVILALQAKGFFTLLSDKRTLTFAELCTQLNANPGHLQTALRLLESLGWVSANTNDEYTLTDAAALHRQIPSDLMALYRFDIEKYLKSSNGSISSWLKHIETRWGLTDERWADFLDGCLLLPLLLTLKQRQHLSLDPNLPLFSNLSRTISEELRELFFQKAWIQTKDAQSLTDKGQFICERVYNMAVTGSYRPLLLALDELLFGDCQTLFSQQLNSGEQHLDRRLNVIGSGFQHEKYFGDIERVVATIFNDVSFEQQPRAMVDMGCGDGTLLKRLYDSICNQTQRGNVLNTYPLLLVGVDYNQAALIETEKTLTACPHLLLQGDINDPTRLCQDLKEAGIDLNSVLHVRSFLDHDRPYQPSSDIAAVQRRAPQKTGVYVDATGQLISSAAMQQNLVEHFKRWASIMGQHGLVILEAHSMAAEIVNRYLDEAENLHFDAYQAFSKQYLMSADAFLRGAAEAGLFPKVSAAKRYPRSLPYTRITLNHFEKRSYVVRSAYPDDIDALVILEQHCWPEAMRCSKQQLLSRILRDPNGQCVIEHNTTVVGVVYSQRLDDVAAIYENNNLQIEALHNPAGKILQLITLNVLPDMQQQGLGDQLLEFMLQVATVSNGIESVIGVTRCRDFAKQDQLNLEDYIKSRTKEGFLCDPTLSFHEQHGALIKNLVPSYREADTDNKGHGVLIEYRLHKSPQQQVKDNQRHEEANITSNQNQRREIIVNTLTTILGERLTAPLVLTTPWLEMDLDSADLMELRSILNQALQENLKPGFFFEYPTPADAMEYLVGSPTTTLKSNRAFVNNTQCDKTESIAVIGLGCRFPGGADSPNQFWQLLQESRDAITQIPASRLALVRYDASHRWGGFLNNIADFDAAFFNINPTEARAMDPQQRIHLEVVWEALENAGINPLTLAEMPVGIFVGLFAEDYKSLCTEAHANKGAYFGTGTSSAVAAGGVAYVLGTTGPAMTINTACSSSLVAVHLACASLFNGECSLAIASGVNIILSPETTQHFAEVGMLAPDGRCKTFDASANGYVRSEGCGVIMLKRLSEALHDRDNVLAVIESSAVNQDGKSSVLTAPNPKAQQQLFSNALKMANLHPADIDYIEAHGTGTKLGDPMEVDSIMAVYDKNRTRPLMIGSVKANIGHTESAAGIAGLIKVILCLQHEAVPPQLHFNTLNPEISATDKLLIPQQLIPWKRNNRSRRAGISSFGFSGTNAHVLIAEAPEMPRPKAQRATHLLTLSAKTEQALHALIETYDQYLQTTHAALEDICYTSHIGRAHFAYRKAIVIASTDDWRQAIHTPEVSRDKVYTQLARSYEAGETVDWQRFHADTAYRKVALPTYPFQREHYWTTTQPHQTLALHPLLGTLHSSAHTEGTEGTEGMVFETVLSEQFPEFVPDHRIYGFPIIAGAGFLSALLTALRDQFQQTQMQISRSEFISPLLFTTAGQSRRVQTTIQPDPQRKNTFNVEIKSCLEDNNHHHPHHWQLHFTALLQLILDTTEPLNSWPNPWLDITALPNFINTLTGAAWHTLAATTLQLRLGPHFQWIETIHVLDDHTAIARLRLPKADENTPAYVLYPGFLDACFQTAVAVLPGNQAILHVPFAIDQCDFFETHTAPCWVIVKLKNENDHQGVFKVDLQLLTETGRVVGSVSGLTLRVVPENALRRATQDNKIVPRSINNHPLSQLLPQEQHRASMREVISQSVRDILGLPTTQIIQVDVGLFDQGMDSLSALELRNHLQKTFRELEPLPSTLLFDYPTLGALTDHITGLLAGTDKNDNTTAVAAQHLTQSSQNHSADEFIAIVGMGCRFPQGADSPDKYWDLLIEGKDAIVEVPADRWDINQYYDPDPTSHGKMITRCGGFMTHPVDQMDAQFFNIMPREAKMLDPQQRLLLEVTWEALEQAGIDPKRLQGSATGVFIGIAVSDYSGLLSEIQNNAEYDAAYRGTGVFFSTASGRLSYALGLQGPNLAIDTACSSSLVGVHLACQSLRCGESNFAIAGGVNIMLSPETFIGFSKAQMLAADGRCKTFDAAADGYARGEGCGVVLLKRLADAERDGDKILAIIRGSAVNQDGASGGLTVPNGIAQQNVIRQALVNARIENPHTVSYIETHGTGTALGDPVEVRALGQVYGQQRANDQPLIIGTAKTNIGHLEAAAGVAGLMKVVLSLQHEKIPQHLHFTTLNPHINLDFPAKIPTDIQSWKKQSSQPRRAGVSSFGFSGTNAHIILEEAPTARLPLEKSRSLPLQLLPFSAKSEPALRAQLAQYKKYFADFPQSSLQDIAMTLQNGRSHFAYRACIVASDVNDALAQLQQLDMGQFTTPSSPSSTMPQLAFTFTGEADWHVLLNSLSQLYTRGLTIDWAAFTAPYHYERMNLPTYPFQRQRYWALPETGNAKFHRIADEIKTMYQNAQITQNKFQHQQAAKLIDRLSAILVLQALYTFGWEPKQGELISVKQTMERFAIQAKQARLFNGCLGMLAEEGYLTAVDADNPLLATSWQVIQLPPALKMLTAEYNQLKAQAAEYPDQRIELGLLIRCGEQLVPLLQGKQNPLSLLFPENNHEISLTTLYTNTATAVLYNNLVATAVQKSLKDAKGPVHILEVGAGTGGTTATVLAALAAMGINYYYTYTDLTAGFFTRAKERFANYPLHYHVLNIESDPKPQGFAPFHYDIIIAANVLHATADIREALRHVRHLLAPHGHVVLLEVTQPQRWLDLTAGLLAGWWRFNDTVRDRTALLRPEQWHAVLKDSDFIAAECIGSGQGVILGKASAASPPLKTDLTPWLGVTPTETQNTSMVSRVSSMPEGDLAELLHTAKSHERREVLQRYLDTLIRNILHLTTGYFLEPAQGLFEQGMDSLMAVELRNYLQQAVGDTIVLPSTLLFDHPNLNALTMYFDKLLLDGKQDERVAENKIRKHSFTREPIAIIGIGCRFPHGVENPTHYWQLLADGVDAMVEVPAARWDVNQYYDPDYKTPGKMVMRRGGFMTQPVDQFDAGFFSISPREAVLMDPQQRLLMEVTWEALERAGIDPEQLQGSATGVFIGICTNDYGSLLARVRDEREHDIAYRASGNAFSATVGRLSYSLGLQGPNMAVDTACSSSLVAVHLACQSLQSGESNLAIAGGVNIMLSPDTAILFSQTQMLSPDGRCKTFDANADGFARGEGSGVVLLKRLADAQSDGDNILAVVRGSAVNQDGASGGFTVPNRVAQENVIKQALANASLHPQQINYIETHGTGTPLGDPIEVHALGTVYGDRRRQDEPLIIGTAKTNVGHLEAASGIAGLIKVILSLQHKTIPQHLHFTQLNPHIHADFPLHIPTEKQHWPQLQNQPRRAGVSSFGFSGTNAHVIVEEAPTVVDMTQQISLPWHILPMSAKSEAALMAQIAQYKKHFTEHPHQPLQDIAMSLQAGRSHFNYRAAIIAQDVTQAVAELEKLTAGPFAGLTHRTPSAPKIAFLFTEPTTLLPGTSQQLFATQPIFKAALEHCADIINPQLDSPLLDLLFGSTHDFAVLSTSLATSLATSLSASHQRVVLFSIAYALAQLWQSWGIVPQCMIAQGLIGKAVIDTLTHQLQLEEALQLMMLTAAISEPNHFTEDKDALIQQGVTVFISIPSDEIQADQKQTDWEVLLGTLRQLYMCGTSINWQQFTAPFSYERIDLPTYPFQRQSYWAGLKPESQRSVLQKAAAEMNTAYLTAKAQQNTQQQKAGAELLNTLSALAVLQALYTLGWQPEIHSEMYLDDLIQQFNIEPQHKRLLESCLMMLVEEGYLSVIKNHWQISKLIPNAAEINKAWSVQSKCAIHFPEQRIELGLLIRCGQRLANVLQGMQEPLALLFPDEASEISLTALYHESFVAEFYNRLFAFGVGQLATSADKPWRILEIGAGTGGTTAHVLHVLTALKNSGVTFEYTYTDISAGFFTKAKTRFADYAIHFQTLNIEHDPLLQYFTAHQYDMVLAANVLHATPDITETLQHVQKLLAPRGRLLLLELVQPLRWLDLTVGLLEGWWRYQDTIRIQQHSTLLTATQWKTVLKEVGFCHVDYVGEEEGIFLAELPHFTLTTSIAANKTVEIPFVAPAAIDLEQLSLVGLTERRSLLQQYVETLVRNVLHLPVSAALLPTHHFLAMGMDSLMMIELRGQLKTDLDTICHIPQTLLFEKQTIQALTLYLDEHILLADTEPAFIIEPNVVSLSEHLASFGQKRLWFLQEFLINKSVYNVPIGFHLTGSLNITALQQSLHDLVARHASLRTVFQWQAEDLMQKIIPILTVPLIRKVLAADETLENYLQSVIEEPFDLSVAPLCRFVLVHTSPVEHTFLMIIHHTIIDGESGFILIKEMQALYNAYVNQTPIILPTLNREYFHTCNAEREWMASDVCVEQSQFWKTYLSNPPPRLALPMDKPQSTTPSHRNDTYVVCLTPEKTAQIKAWCQTQKITLFTGLLTAYAILLMRYTGQDDFIIGTIITNRGKPQLANIVGFLINTLALRIQFDGSQTVSEVVQYVWETVKNALSHGELPYDEVIKQLIVKRDTINTSLFQTLFVLQKELPQLHLSELTAIPINESQGSELDLSVEAVDTTAGLQCVVKYNIDLFSKDMMVRMFEHYQRLLTAMITEPTQLISQLRFLSLQELDQQLIQWNQTEIHYPSNQTLSELFAAQVEKTPDNMALVFEDQTLTYRQLDEKANQLAHYLLEQNVGENTIVALAVERSLEMVIAMLAVLKAGGAYLPLDTSYPPERLNYMVSSSKAVLLLTQADIQKQLVAYQGKRAEPFVRLKPHQLAYVIYTSGSTGRPKGVMINHSAVINYCYWAMDAYDYTSHDTLLARASFSFDTSVYELFVPLLVGAKVIIANQEAQKDLQQLVALMHQHQVTTVEFFPSLLRNLINMTDLVLPKSIRLISCGGEEFNKELLESYNRRFAVRLHNSYGPTETTIAALDYRCHLEPSSECMGHAVPIGRAIANTKLYVLDEHLQPVPIGVAGELYIGGAGLSNGYLHQPELTAERFIMDPFVTPLEYLYRTGDRVCYLANGNLVYLGRYDQQIKLRGFRIEVGEIQTLLEQQPYIKEAVVLLRDDQPGLPLLVAYIVSTLNHSAEPAPLSLITELHNVLIEKLPSYMVPSVIVPLQELPLLANGKLDRNALPVPEQNHFMITAKYTPPRNPIEFTLAAIWQQLLGMERVGIHDNFFELGGNSLALIQLIARMKQTFIQEIPLATAYKMPTIAQLAPFCAKEAAVLASDILLPVQTEGTLHPLFLIHPGAGNAFPYLALKGLLPDQPVYGINNPRFTQPENPFANIEEMATLYIETIKSVQSRGPYRLGGWSLGGTVALEIAQQLKQNGETVEILLMLDSMNLYGLSTGVKEAAHSMKDVWVADGVLANYQESLPGELNYLQKTYENSAALALHYEPKPYHGRVVLFKVEDKDMKFTTPLPAFAQQELHALANSPLNGWDLALHASIETVIIPGSHQELLNPNYVKTTAEKMRAVLETLT